MPLYSRREALTKLTTTTGAIVLGSAPADVTWAQGALATLHVRGQILSLNGNTIQAYNEAGAISLELDGQSDVWKGLHNMPWNALNPGDIIDVKGEARVDGTIVVRWLFANIVNNYGNVLATQNDEFLLVPYRPGPLNIVLRHVVNRNFNTIFENASATDIQPGHFVQVVGLALPTGSIHATRIWVYPS
jgi:hypothetical protein